MIAQLIAIGVFASAGGPPVGAVNVPEERTAIVARIQASAPTSDGIPLGAVEWQQAYDPADHAPYAFDFSSILAEGETISDILSIRLSSAAAALGIAVDQAASFSPVIDAAEGKKVQLWFVVADDLQEAASFLATGVKIPVAVKIETSSTPPKRFERTNVLTVRQL